jgi:hypothetical protein
MGVAVEYIAGRSPRCPTYIRVVHFTFVPARIDAPVIARTSLLLNRAASSAGRALRSQRRGREFEPPAVHQIVRGWWLVVGCDQLTTNHTPPTTHHQPHTTNHTPPSPAAYCLSQNVRLSILRPCTSLPVVTIVRVLPSAATLIRAVVVIFPSTLLTYW